MAHRFELVGGHAVLDFVNTVHDWTVPEPREYLPTFGEALRFGTVAGLLRPAEARQLARSNAARELQQLRALRARLQRILHAQVAGEPAAPDDLATLARDAADAARAVRLLQRNRQVERSIEPARAGQRTLRLRLADAALDLLTSRDMERLKSCPSCGWFFLDVSKNRSRRWCSMTACGSVAKSHRFYWRTKHRRAQTQGAPASTP
jgi:predicted RNA-binding Zn ribbon-like protein